MNRSLTSALLAITLTLGCGGAAVAQADHRIDALQAMSKKDNYISARKLAKGGNLYAALYLGYELIKSTSKKVRSEGVSFIIKAADQGLPAANVSLGVMYLNGQEVQLNKYQAISRFRMAAMVGDAEGQQRLGLLYLLGEGALQDYSEANKYFQMSAKQGNGPAQEMLGLSYRYGNGVKQNKVISHMWLNLASSIEDPFGINADEISRAKKFRDELSDEMSSAQLLEAQQMARVCRASNYQQCE